MNLQPMKQVVCRSMDCKKSTLLPASKLEQIFQRLPESNPALRQLVFLCPKCSHFGFVHTPKDQLPEHQSELPAGISLFLVWLECDKKCPGFQIPVLALKKKGWDKDTAQVSADMKEWTCDGATCPQDHPPIYPLDRALRGITEIL